MSRINLFPGQGGYGEVSSAGNGKSNGSGYGTWCTAGHGNSFGDGDGTRNGGNGKSRGSGRNNSHDNDSSLILIS